MTQAYQVMDSWDMNGGRLRWHGHSSVSLSLPGLRMYVDPYRMYGTWPPADFILITHPHFDHLDPLSLRSLCKETTRLLCPEGMDPPEEVKPLDVRRISPGERTSFSSEIGYRLSIEAYHAYTPDRRFHPREKGWVGYVIETPDQRIYHAGDTGPHDRTPRDIDLALLPVDGIYTMDARTAARWANEAGFQTAAPIHYDTLRGGVMDAVMFCRSLIGATPVRLRAIRTM